MGRFRIVSFSLVAVILVLAFMLLAIGSVDVPLGEVVGILTGTPSENSAWNFIILESRVPLIVTSALAGAA